MKTTKEITPEQREKRKKLLLFLPVLILLFSALIFMAFGGGKGNTAQATAQQKGINTELPSAQFKGEKPQDKLSLYDQADKDSVSAKTSAGNSAFTSLKTGASPSAEAAANNEAQLNQKLTQLRQVISQPPQQPPVTKPVVTATDNSPALNPADIDRLEKLAQGMKNQQTEDPQMRQLAGMMDKLLQLQHPELVTQQLKQQQKTAAPDSVFKAIPAGIDGNQKVAPGGTVKLRLADSVRLKGILLPKGFNLFGNCTVTNQRLLLNIKSIRLGTSIIPVDLTVYYTDGLPGLPAPEAELADAGGNGASNAVQSMEFMPMDQTLATQAAAGGIEAAKTLFSKKVRKIRVKLHNGQPVLLKNNQP